MALSSCRHPDIRKFDGIRCCLACGLAIFEPLSSIGHVQDEEINAPYRYRALNYELGQEIRLIELHMGRPADPITCNIIHANLLDDPIFEAVSYTWATEDGDDSLSQVIHCSNKVIAVTSNCHAALRRFREIGRQRVLWLDAICINQSNVLGRNHQVGLMDEIYSRATVVLIHIEQPFGGSSRVFHWLKRSSTTHINDCSVLASVSDFLKLRWFTRVWVIQEVALARQAVLAVGTNSIELSVDVLIRLTKLCNQYSITVPGPLLWTSGQHNRFEILDCLSTARRSASKDPRDKVFAVLSLMDASIRSLVEIDYSESVEKVYLNMATVSILKQRHFGIFAHIDLEKSKPNLPSWVPDWTVTPSATISKLPYQFTRGPSLKPSITLNQDYPSLLYGKIGWAGPSISDGAETVDYAVFTEAGVCIETGVRDNNPEMHPSTNMFDLSSCVKTRNFILSTGQCVCARDHPPPSPHSSTFSKVPWISSLSANLCTSPNFEITDPEHIIQQPPSSSVAEIVQPDNIPASSGFESGPLRSYLRVHATYLDTISQGPREGWASGSAVDVKRFDTSINKLTLPFFLQTEEYLMIKWNPSSSLVTEIDIPFYSTKDLTCFLADAENYGDQRRMFHTIYSVGFAGNCFKAGDVVFAIDGATSPMILRKCGENQYKVVGECYLWAAAEKNHWSVGIGSCPDQQRGSATFGKRHKEYEQWTDMIEIH